MRKLVGLFCDKFYKFSKKVVFILTRYLNIHIIRTFVFVTTYKCNSKCIMCDIWRMNNKKFKDVSFVKFKQILDDKSLKNVKTFALTGGEPFIRLDLYKVYNFIKKKFPPKKIIISTNGLLKNNIVDFLEKITDKSNLVLIISLDSIKKTDYIKGIENSFNKVLNTIRTIKLKFPSIRLFIKFTINPWNYNEILNVYELSKKERVNFSIKVIENLSNYNIAISNYKQNKQKFQFNDYKKELILKQLKKLRSNQLERLDFRASAFTKELIIYFSKKNYVLSNCALSFYSVFIIQNGDVYLCRRFKSIGNIYEDKIDRMWNSKIAKEIRYSKCKSCASHYGFYNGLI